MSLTLEIVTPVGVVYRKGELDAVTLPASDGEIQILPGHIPLITILDAGAVLAISGGSEESIAVDTGYARCIADTVSVLTESAIDVQRFDEDEMQKAREAAEKALEEAKNANVDPDEIERLESRARVAIAGLLAAARGHKLARQSAPKLLRNLRHIKMLEAKRYLPALSVR